MCSACPGRFGCMRQTYDANTDSCHVFKMKDTFLDCDRMGGQPLDIGCKALIINNLVLHNYCIWIIIRVVVRAPLSSSLLRLTSTHSPSSDIVGIWILVRLNRNCFEYLSHQGLLAGRWLMKSACLSSVMELWGNGVCDRNPESEKTRKETTNSQHTISVARVSFSVKRLYLYCMWPHSEKINFEAIQIMTATALLSPLLWHIKPRRPHPAHQSTLLVWPRMLRIPTQWQWSMAPLTLLAGSMPFWPF